MSDEQVSRGVRRWLPRVAPERGVDEPARAVASGVAIDLVLFAADLALSSHSGIVATFLLAPLVLALIGGPRETAAVAALSVALGLTSGAAHGQLGHADFLVRIAVLVAGGALATVGAGARARTRATLRRFELLAAVGEVADGSLTLHETVERVLNLIVPEFADLVVLDAVDAGAGPAGLRRLGARIDAPDRERIEAALMRRRIVPDADVGSALVSREVRSQLIATFTDQHLLTLANDASDEQLLRSLRLRSLVFVPLRSRGRMIGTLGCSVGTSGRVYDETDLRFAEVLSGRVALALDNAGLTAEVTSLERQLDATLTNLAEAVTVQDSHGRTVFANPAAVELLGLGSESELIDAAPGEIMSRFTVTDERGRPVELGDLPAARAVRGERPEPLVVRNVVRATGEERWLVNKATPVRDPDGRVGLVVNVIENVTEIKRAEFAQGLLAEAGALLSSSLDFEHTLQQVAQLAVPELADWCGVSMPDDAGLLRQVAVAHADPDRIPLARRLGQRYPSRMSDETGAAQVIRTGESLLVSDIPDELIARAAVDAEHLSLLRALQMRSVLIVPLTTGQETLGVLSMIEAESGRVFSDEDRALAEELARRAAIAVANARLYTERSAIADTLQRSLLPPALPAVAGFELASFYRAAGVQNDVGGDFYDVFQAGGGWAAVVGDVAGRGAEAAALTSLARYTLRTAMQLVGEPVAAAERLNVALRERPEVSLVSICCALVRERGALAEAEVLCAGHPLPWLVRADGRAEQVGTFGFFLGAFEDGEWTAARVPLAPGDMLVLYTDGVTDTVGEHERFGEERLGRTLAGARDAQDAVARIEAALSAFARGAQTDDTAVLAIRRLQG